MTDGSFWKDAAGHAYGVLVVVAIFAAVPFAFLLYVEYIMFLCRLLGIGPSHE